MKPLRKLETIGQRAVWAIEERCVERRTKKQEEMPKIGVPSSTLSFWRHGKTEPSGFILAAMAKEGYDVMWILTGEQS